MGCRLATHFFYSPEIIESVKEHLTIGESPPRVAHRLPGRMHLLAAVWVIVYGLIENKPLICQVKEYLLFHRLRCQQYQ